MGYDITLKDASTGETIILDHRHDIKGSTYAAGGTQEAWIAVTSNYYPAFQKALGESGIRLIHGMTGRKAISVLTEAANRLKDDETTNYWDATEGNAKQALLKIISLAELSPDGVLDVEH